MITSFAHVSIRVSDLEVSKHFYLNTLGLEHQRDVENELLRFSFLKAGSTVIELVQQKNGGLPRPQAGAVDHIAFMVDDLSSEITRLKALQVHFTMEEPKEALEYHIIFLEGPDHERIELMQVREDHSPVIFKVYSKRGMSIRLRKDTPLFLLVKTL